MCESGKGGMGVGAMSVATTGPHSSPAQHPPPARSPAPPPAACRVHLTCPGTAGAAAAGAERRGRRGDATEQAAAQAGERRRRRRWPARPARLGIAEAAERTAHSHGQQPQQPTAMERLPKGSTNVWGSARRPGRFLRLPHLGMSLDVCHRAGAERADANSGVGSRAGAGCGASGAL